MSTETTTSETNTEKKASRTSRRNMLRLAVPAAAGVAALAAAGVTELAHSGTAQAHFDGPTELQTAAGAGNWAIEGNGSSGADGLHGISDTGAGVIAVSGNGVGMFGQSTNSLGIHGFSINNIGVRGTANANWGVYGASNSSDGVHGSSGTGVGVVGVSSNFVGTAGFGGGPGGVGGWFAGPRAALALGSAGTPGAPTSGAHFIGDIYLDSTATVWTCIANGTPGVWTRLTRLLSDSRGGIHSFLSVPIRIVDTRGGAPVTHGGSPLGPSQTLTAQITGTSVGGVSVPPGAVAIFGNLTALPFANGDLTIYASGQPKPNVSNLNYNSGLNVANSVTTLLSGAGAVDIFSNVGTCNVILDVTGFIV